MVRDDAPRRSGTSEEVYRELRGLILRNRIAPGERVNIDALAREFDVSQTPVREAVRRLEGDQLLRRAAGRGYTTVPLLDLDSLRELFEFRLVIDSWAVPSVAENRLSNPAPALHAEIEAFEAAAARGTGDIRPLLLEHDLTFHGLVLSALGNDVVKDAYDQTHCHFHAFRLYSADTDGQVTISEHRRLAEAIGNCDKEDAENAARAHLTNAYHRFATYFEKEAPPTRQPGQYPVF